MNTIYDAALMYIEFGYSILPVKGKKPALSSWAILNERRATVRTLNYWRDRGFLSGVGIICGEISYNLAVIDLDGLDAVAEFEMRFPDFLDTYTVLSGSGRGKHLYYRTPEYTPTTRTKGFELRSNGCYVVAPPSPHESGRFYKAVNNAPIMVLDLHPVASWIKRKINSTPAPVAPVLAAPRRAGNGNESMRKEWYFNSALRGEVARVRSASEGTRNDTLFLATRRLAGLLHEAGSEGEIRAAMQSAAERAGTPPLEAAKTIESAVRHGKNRPRSIGQRS
jgi:hypothetical protein